MHIQPPFADTDRLSLHAQMRAHPLATLVATTTLGLEAHLLPLECVEPASADALPQLRGHVVREHPLARDTPAGSDVLVVFQGPSAYISPRWYVNGQRSRRVAPSWNYVAVQARGAIRFVDDRDSLLRHLAALTHAQEAHRNTPWSLHDASAEFIDDVAQRLIGFEIAVEQLAGKRMLSQQRTEADRRSLIEHLAREPSGTARDLGALIVP